MSLVNWLNQPFELLDKKKERSLLVLTTGIFAILFFNFYIPFNVRNWHSNDSIPMFLKLSSYGIIGMVILSISQFVVRPLFKIKTVTNKAFLKFFFAELLVLSLVMFLIYGDKNGDGVSILLEFFQTFRYTFLILSLPYFATLYYLYNKKQRSEYTRIDNSDNIIKLLDENGNIRLMIEPEKLLYIKNADNYVEIYYSADDVIKKELIRTSLKRLEIELEIFRISRCHRSFMVNLNNISFSKETKNGLVLELKTSNSPLIPVSKNYKSLILSSI